MNGSKFKIFWEKDINQLFQQLEDSMKYCIKKESEDYILNVNETEFIECLEIQHKIKVAELHFDKKYISTYEKQIPAEWFPKSFHVDKGEFYPKDIIVYHIPFTGYGAFFKWKPGAGMIVWTTDTYIEDNSLCFEIINFYDDSDKVGRRYQEIEVNVQRNYRCLITHCEKFNKNLRDYISSHLSRTKQKYLKRHNFLASLDVPLKRTKNVPETFSVPSPKTRRRIKIKKPEVTHKGNALEPKLNNENYMEILKTINDVGKVFEQLPSTYKDKNENVLRDHILLFLEPNFEGGTATGETFNKTGKTDILLRYESSNVFIAECKYWRGKKKYLKSIDQLLSYLTWRDSKAAIIIFVKNNDFSNVLGNIEQTTKEHNNYIGLLDKTSETWFNYRFHLIDDANREVRIAVMAFHLPSVN